MHIHDLAALIFCPVIGLGAALFFVLVNRVQRNGGIFGGAHIEREKLNAAERASYLTRYRTIQAKLTYSAAGVSLIAGIVAGIGFGLL